MRDRILRSVKIVSETGCWEWQLFREPAPKMTYGRMYFGKKYKMAHRVAYETLVGPIPDGLCVLHKCDNPPCCNPDHLFLGTITDNNADRVAKGRGARGERSGRRLYPERYERGDEHWTRRMPEKVLRLNNHPRARITQDIADEIRARVAVGENQSALAREFGIGRTTLGHLVAGRTWVRGSASR